MVLLLSSSFFVYTFRCCNRDSLFRLLKVVAERKKKKKQKKKRAVAAAM